MAVALEAELMPETATGFVVAALSVSVLTAFVVTVGVTTLVFAVTEFVAKFPRLSRFTIALAILEAVGA
jgi:hypothetical protein